MPRWPRDGGAGDARWVFRAGSSRAQRLARLPWVIAIVSMTSCAGCTSTVANFHGQDSAERIRAIRRAAEGNHRSAIPLIVERLEDDDQAVRFYAILALDRLTGERLGYDYAKPSWKRADAVERWWEYVRQGRHAAGADAHEKGEVARGTDATRDAAEGM